MTIALRSAGCRTTLPAPPRWVIGPAAVHSACDPAAPIPCSSAPVVPPSPRRSPLALALAWVPRPRCPTRMPPGERRPRSPPPRTAANDAAAAFAEAESELEVLEDEAVELQRRHDELGAEVDALQAEVETAAVELFAGAGPGPDRRADRATALQRRPAGPGARRRRAGELGRLARRVRVGRLALDAAEEELAANQAALEQRAGTTGPRTGRGGGRPPPEGRAAAARGRACASPWPPSAVPRRRRRRAEEARAAQAARPPRPRRGCRGGEARQAAPQSNAHQQRPPRRGAVTPEQTAGRLLPSRASAAAGVIICPVRGSLAYSDSWGAARSGRPVARRRRHDGVDGDTARRGRLGLGAVQAQQPRRLRDLAEGRGRRPLPTPTSPRSRLQPRRRAGRGHRLRRHDGQRRRPHLHFEVHPGGASAVNPYPYVVAAGC